VNILNENHQDCNKIDEFRETSDRKSIEEIQPQKQTLISPDELLKIEQEAKILSEQIDTLTQELEHERQRVEGYHQELVYTNQEMRLLNGELQDVLRFERMKLKQAQQLGTNILSTHQSSSECLAQLLSSLYGVVVKAEELSLVI
jgi:phosphatidate phosphatase PAH1